jgi:hypothetical protein
VDENDRRLYRIPTASVIENDGSVAAHDADSQMERTQCMYVGGHTQDGDAVRERQLVSTAPTCKPCEHTHSILFRCIAPRIC